MDLLPSGGLDERGKDAVRLDAVVRSRAEAYLPEDHHMPERLFGVIVRGRNACYAQKGEEMFLFRADEKRPQGLGWLERKRLFANSAQLTGEPFFEVRGVLPGNLAGFQFLPRVAGPRAEVVNLVAEDCDAPILLPDRQERVFPADVPGVGDDMRQTGLPVATDAVVGGVPVPHQRSVESLSEDGLCRFRGPMPVYMEKGEVLISREPHKVPLAVISP